MPIWHYYDNLAERLDRVALDELVAWMRLRGVVVLESADVKLALGPEPPPPPTPVVLLTPEEEHRQLWASAVVQAEEHAHNMFPNSALPKAEIEKLATQLTGVLPCT